MVELVVVVAVLGFLAMYAVPSFMLWVQNSTIRTTAETILSGLQQARTEAVRRNTLVEFSLSDNVGSAGAAGWSVWLASADRDNDTPLAMKADSEAAGKAVVTTDLADGTIRFNGMGRPSNAVGGQIDIDSSALSATDSRELRIVISTGGLIRMCDPNVSTTGDPRKC